jgi:homoserine acetyltransferase
VPFPSASFPIPKTPLGETDTAEVECFHIYTFNFLGGAELKDVKVAYQSFNLEYSKAVLIPTCYDGRINSTLNFTSGSSSHMLGNGQSTSPSNETLFPTDLTRLVARIA